jgi:hypothetical protein
LSGSKNSYRSFSRRRYPIGFIKTPPKDQRQRQRESEAGFQAGGEDNFPFISRVG